MRRTNIAVLFSFLSVSSLTAQDHFLEVAPDKKIINVDMLDLPEDTPVSFILQILPELLFRNEEDFNNFDLQLDGKSVGASRDALISSTRISDLEKIQVSISSVSTQQKNGKAGVINFIPRRKEENGYEGEAMLMSSTLASIIPSANFKFKKDKFEMSAYASTENYLPNGKSRENVSEQPGITMIGTEMDYTKLFQETAKAWFSYKFDDKNELKGWLIQYYTGNKGAHISESTEITDGSAIHGPGWAYTEVSRDSSYSESRKFAFNAMAEFCHTFNEDSKLKASAGYQYESGSQDFIKTIPNTLDGQVEYNFPLVKSEGHRLQMKFVVNGSHKTIETDISKSTNNYLSPLAELNYKGKKLSVQAAFRYQLLERKYDVKDILAHEVKKTYEDDLIGNINTIWQFTPNKAIRLSLGRNLVRPDDMMIYPSMVWYQSEKQWIIGNPDLQSAYYYNADLDYITDWTRNGKYFVFNAGIGYNRVEGIFEKRITHEDHTEVFFATYVNSGINDIATGNVSFMYASDIFKMSIAGNFFSNFKFENGRHDHYNYFNISASPAFNFKNGWDMYWKFVYNSKVEQVETDLGDCFYAGLRIGKRLKNWILAVELSDIFGYETVDVTRSGQKRVISTYDLYTRYVGIGATYKFGNRYKNH